VGRLVLAPANGSVNLCNEPAEFYVPAVFGAESPSPRSVVGRILGLATLAAAVVLLVVLVRTGHIPWQLVTFVGILWAAWGLLSGLFTQLIEPAVRFFANHLTGNLPLPEQHDTLDEQTARLERLLEQVTTPHHEILIGIRLAEIYRTHLRDAEKSAALLARLRTKYPDAPELVHAERD